MSNADQKPEEAQDLYDHHFRTWVKQDDGPPDFYDLLGVALLATPDEIKKAYRKLARDLHPDHNPDNIENAERFKAVSEAFDWLSDDDKHAAYNQFWRLFKLGYYDTYRAMKRGAAAEAAAAAERAAKAAEEKARKEAEARRKREVAEKAAETARQKAKEERQKAAASNPTSAAADPDPPATPAASTPRPVSAYQRPSLADFWRSARRPVLIVAAVVTMMYSGLFILGTGTFNAPAAAQAPPAATAPSADSSVQPDSDADQPTPVPQAKTKAAGTKAGGYTLLGHNPCRSSQAAHWLKLTHPLANDWGAWTNHWSYTYGGDSGPQISLLGYNVGTNEMTVGSNASLIGMVATDTHGAVHWYATSKNRRQTAPLRDPASKTRLTQVLYCAQA